MYSLYNEYASVEAQIKELEDKKEQLRNHILNNMIKKGEEKVATDVGSFSVTMRKVWTYPEKVLELGEKFKSAKAKAESTGDATFVEQPSLRFTQIKL